VRAARLHAFGSDPTVEQVPEPVQGEDESLIELRAAAVGHIDLTVAGGEFAHRPALPHTPGVEGAGVVVRSARLSPGTPVRVRGAGVGLVRSGTWAELVAAPDAALHVLPDGVDAPLAATFFAPCATAHVAVHEIGRCKPGERVAVTGATGAVGCVAVQLALRAGASVVAVVGRPEKREAVSTGAEVVLATEDDAVKAAHGPDGIDLLVDTVGGEPLKALLGAVRPGGRAALVGYTAGTRLVLDLPAFLAADVVMLPVNLMRWHDRLGAVGRGLLEELRNGGLSLPVTPYELDDVARAVVALRSGRAIGRIALVP
jgi:NADPH2:quinone reductase